MRPPLRSTVSAVIAAALLVTAGCGGDDDNGATDLQPADIASDETSGSDSNDNDNDSNDSDSNDNDSNDNDNDNASDVGVGFGNFESGQIAVAGAEDVTYAVGDPALGFISSGGCGGQNYGLSANVQNADAQVTVAQVSVNLDEDMSGGRTGTFPAEEITLLIVPDGDMMSARSYEGPGTLDVIEHDNAAPDFDPNQRRTVLSLTGTLEPTGDTADGAVELDADLVWVMGCP